MAASRVQRYRVSIIALLLALAGAVLLFSGDSAHASGRFIERVGPGGPYYGIAISADGRFVAFVDSIAAGATGEILIRDREANTTQGLGVRGADFGGLGLSADGRYLAFSGTELVPGACGDPPGCNGGVYVYDRQLGTFETVPGASAGYNNPSISADGRFVLFGYDGLYVRDRLLGTTDFIGGGLWIRASMSADGRFIAFDDRPSGVFAHDRDTDGDGVYGEPGSVETVLLDAQGVWPVISDDGRFVAYEAGGNVVLRDRQSGASTTAAEGAAYGGTVMDLSGDGRFLAFATPVALVPEDTNGFTDVYLYDRLSSTSELLSVAGDGSLGNDHSAWGFPKERLAVIALTPDARYAAFHSAATNLVPDGEPGVFVSLPDDLDTDKDGCSNKRELGPDERAGGRRNPDNFWDVFDVPTGSPLQRDGVVSIGDIGGVVARFGASGDPSADPLSPPPPAPAYHPAYDRGGSIPGQDPWDLLPADGSISVGDVGAAVAQFGHSCA